MNRRERAKQLCIASVIIAVWCAALLYVGVGVWVVEESKAPRDTSNKVLYPDQSEDQIPGDVRFTGNGPLPQGPRYMALPLAPHCDHLYNHPGMHRAWAECMGVGYDNSKIDRRLYELREGYGPDCTKFPLKGPYHEWLAHCAPVGGD